MDFRRFAAAGGLVLALGSACGEAEPARPAPVVVLVLLDALHADHVSHLGYRRPTTPQLDALAAEGVTFRQVLAPAPYTLASVPSLLTGRRPDRHGLTRKRAGGLPEEELTLAERLQDLGWQTFGATSNLNAGVRTNTDQGFDRFEEVYLGVGPPGATVMETPEGALHVPDAEEFPAVLESFLADRDPARPTLLYLHILEPHSPYDPPAEFRERWLDPDYEGPFLDGRSETLIATLYGNQEFTAEDQEAVIALYDANLAHADDVLGRLFERLRQEGLWDEALVAVTSDHGEAMWQHGRWGHNSQLYDEMLHVPLVIKPPAAEKVRGVEIDALASLCDVVPTILEWLNIPQRGAVELDGVSLVPLVRGAAADPTREIVLRDHDELPGVALRSADSKFIAIPEPLEGEQSGFTFRPERYDLRSDPEERSNLADPDDAEVQQRLRFLAELSRNFRRRAKTAAGQDESYGEMMSKMLEALGYGGDEPSPPKSDDEQQEE